MSTITELKVLEMKIPALVYTGSQVSTITELEVLEMKIPALVDTGSQVSTITESFFRRFQPLWIQALR